MEQLSIEINLFLGRLFKLELGRIFVFVIKKQREREIIVSVCKYSVLGLYFSNGPLYLAFD